MNDAPARSALDGLDALLAAATPGEWQYDPETPGEVWDGDERFPHVLGGCEESADAALIVALRNAAPAMVAAIRAAYALVEELESAAELYDAAALDGRLTGDLMTEAGHLIQAGDARRFAAHLRAALDEALAVTA